MRLSTLLDFIDERNNKNTQLIEEKKQNFTFEIDNGGFLRHPRIKTGKIKAREFQLNISKNALLKNTLVVLPTGLGKTIIAAFVSAEILHSKKGKIIFLAPTKPLVNQHKETFEKILIFNDNNEKRVIFTGDIKPKERVKIFNFDDTKIIFSTPQLIKNDLKKEGYSLKDVDLLIIDEAHRAVGNYAYVFIAEKYMEIENPLILALTASPGGKKERINEVIKNLYIEQIEARTEDDFDVKEYVKEIRIFWEKVSLTEKQKDIQKILEKFLIEKIEKLQKVGFLTYKKAKYVSKKDLIEIGNKLKKRLFSRRIKKGYLFGLMYNQSLALLFYHCIELLETQGNKPLFEYMKRIFEKENPNRAEKSFVNNLEVREIYSMLKKEVEEQKISHPKLEPLTKIVEKQFNEKRDSLILIFSQYRDTIDSIIHELNLNKIKAIKFVGQASRYGKKGLSQEKQKEILDKFKNHEFNILVASSVAEEGIDIPNVDLVIFYEPIPSEIRAIQRRGRTGRSNIGKVVILITENSRDEAYLYAEMQREKKMQKMINWLKKKSQ